MKPWMDWFRMWHRTAASGCLILGANFAPRWQSIGFHRHWSDVLWSTWHREGCDYICWVHLQRLCVCVCEMSKYPSKRERLWARERHKHTLICSGSGLLSNNDCVIGLSWLLAALQLQLTEKLTCRVQAGVNKGSRGSWPLQETRLWEREGGEWKGRLSETSDKRNVCLSRMVTDRFDFWELLKTAREEERWSVFGGGRRDALWQESLADTAGLLVTPLYTGNRNKQGCRHRRRLLPL